MGREDVGCLIDDIHNAFRYQDKYMKTIPDYEMNALLNGFEGKSFSTFEFAMALKRKFKQTWDAIELEYGAGGRNAGRHYSAFSRIAHVLDVWARDGSLKKLNYRPAPENWGSPNIRYWTTSGLELDEIDVDNEAIPEGDKKVVIVNKYERSLKARAACIKKWGSKCVVCSFDFGKPYGQIGDGFIHIHHLKPLGEIGKEHMLNPEEELRPVCPNCHAMLHSSSECLSIEDLKLLLQDTRG